MVKPEPAGNAAPLVRAQFRQKVRVGFGGLQHFDQANFGIGRAVAGFHPFAHGVFQAHVQRVKTQFVAHLVQQRFHGKGRHGRAGCAVGGGFGAVGQNLDPVMLHSGNVIAGQSAAQGFAHWRSAQERAALHPEVHLGGGQFAVLGHAQLYVH